MVGRRPVTSDPFPVMNGRHFRPLQRTAAPATGDQSIFSLRGAVASAGGVPIVVNDKLLGAIGLSDGSAQQDHDRGPADDRSARHGQSRYWLLVLHRLLYWER